MAGNRHADNIGTNIIALQHPRETLPEFIHRCDMLRDGQEGIVPAVQAQPELCEDCAGGGYVLDGAQKFKCLSCDGVGVKQ